MSKGKAAVWNFLEEPDSGYGAYLFSTLWPLFIAISAFAALAQTFQLSKLLVLMLAAFNTFADTVFLAEFLLRFSVAPSVCRFVRKRSTVVDALATLPLALRLSFAGDVPTDEGSDLWRNTAWYCLVCLVPIIRLSKLMRTFRYSKLLMKVIDSVKEALRFLVFLMFMMLLIFASLFYVVEPRHTVSSLPEAIWFSVVTMTTVGYQTPETVAGHLVVSAQMVLSLLYMAMPIGVLGNAFTNVWADRDRILLIDSARSRLDQWGYTARDIKGIFKHFDKDGDGELSLSEFKNMISEMEVGIKEDRVVGLFETIDKDGGGSIDVKEFVKALFPESFHELFSLGKKKSRSKELLRISPVRVPRTLFKQ